MKYLFYDCEVANSFNKISKMCSLGYVYTKDDFTILKKEDILINPEDQFDYHLFKNKDIKLYYSPKEFKSHKNFKDQYEKIKSLFLNADIVFGFSIENDIKFLLDDCTRYNLEYPNFKYIDVQTLFKKYHNNKLDSSLEYCVSYYNIKNHLFLHKSDDDAYQTMLVLKSLLQESGMSLDEIIDKCSVKILDVFDYIRKVERRKAIKEAKRKAYEEECKRLSLLHDFYDKKKNDGILNGCKYTFLRSASKYIEEALMAQKYIYDNGGVSMRHYEAGMYIVIKSLDEINSKIPDAKFILISDLIK